MSREIKFRAWNGSAMIMPDDKSYYQHYLSFCGNIVQKSSEGMACFGGNDSWRVIRKLELTQFTGLRDVNGVEIYEGDFICVDDYDDGERMFFGVVKFGVRGYPAFDIYNNKNETYTDEYNTFTNDNDLTFKVIGNIYEHPHLLDEAK